MVISLNMETLPNDNRMIKTAKSENFYLTETIQVIDSHTCGEPTRIITSGFPELGNGTLKQRMERFEKEFDHIRSAVVNEPRGSDVVVGGLLCEPHDTSCSAGIIFFNNVGFLGMCGHGTIGLIETLLFMGKINPGNHRIETPVGIVETALNDNGEITVFNVPAYVYKTDLKLTIDDYGDIKGDIAWGGNWFFLTDSPKDLDVTKDNIARLTHFTKEVRKALAKQGLTGAENAPVDHVEVFGSPTKIEADSKNFVLCPGGAYDRSPCGTGTSAKMACLYQKGQLPLGKIWHQESILGGIFQGSLQKEGDKLIPNIKGKAFITAESTLIFHPSDPYRTGIRFVVGL